MDDIDPEEFVVEENLNYKEMSVNEGVGKDNETIKTSNVPSPPAEEPPSEAICSGPLTFDSLIPRLTKRKIRTRRSLLPTIKWS